MTSKKMIQNMALALTIATAGSILLPNLVSAKSLDNPKQVNIETNSTKNAQNSTISQELINKATPFIKTTQNEFYLSKEGYSSLNSNEIKIVSSYIINANAALKDVAKSGKLIQKDNAFVQSTSTSNSFLSNRTMSARASAQYLDITYTWWGCRIYFSSSAISDLKDFLYLGGTVSAFLLKAGKTVSSGYLASISLFVGPLDWAMAKLDKGNGVYLNCVMYVPCTLDPA